MSLTEACEANSVVCVGCVCRAFQEGAILSARPKGPRLKTKICTDHDPLARNWSANNVFNSKANL